MKNLLLSLLLASTSALAAAASLEVTLDPPSKAALALPADAAGRHRSGIVRTLPKAAALTEWTAERGGYVARVNATSKGALSLRVRLDLSKLPGAVELRAQGTGGGVETMTVEPLLGPVAWTPWTEGETQSIEIFSAVRPPDASLNVGAIVHMTETPFPKASSSCTLSTSCPTGDGTLDAAIAERKKSLLRISFIDGGSAFLCSATLVDTPLHAPFVLTANHCIGNENSAASVTSNFFYEQTPCGFLTFDPLTKQVAGGMSMVFPNYNTDMTMLRMNLSPPEGVTYAPLNQFRANEGQAVVTLSHPRGDAARYTTGTIVGTTRNFDLPYDMYWVSMDKGLIEPGSSGSGLYTLNSQGQLELRGVTSAASEDLSCTATTGATIFGRVEVMYPQMAPFIGISNPGPDDAVNRVKDWAAVPNTGAGTDLPLNVQPGGTIDFGTHVINYGGDVDIYRFYLTGKRVVTLRTSGGIDTVATLMDASGEAIAANDDAQSGGLDSGITHSLPAGTYYIHVAHWDPSLTGAYGLKVTMVDAGPDNYTASWWNAAESGWGVNVNHQGNIIVATLFTYDTDGTPMWLIMSRGERQADGSFLGDLYRVTGPVFNAQPWGSFNPVAVGTMKFTFASKTSAVMTYSVNGTQVVKNITPQEFGTRPDCDWSDFDRTYAFNYTDLWWAAAEPGWGINFEHQGNIIFATLFTYDAENKPRWYLLSRGARTSNGVYSGELYRTSGPPFNASPWTPVTPIQVGNMTISITNGNKASITYSINGTSVVKDITRQTFASPHVQCEP
ncbi:hypothetical protein DSM104443_01133 [Usitatibacter rugosus]|uniref:Peptidase C-terminal archaeal/bacterial domain-containing protein n=1 Tax=Usitatibacter rugosus TaxID=2732067 RepID=A0A6M4GSJ6_9PROT|nr:DVUA0089 family protein [Usitatibacter rugosus]QJR10082.1 hypothetical protein DSM104443_01133 [Usitatibacter rugosus]